MTSLEQAVKEWADARKAVTDSEWKKTECTPAMVQRLASAEAAMARWVKEN